MFYPIGENTLFRHTPWHGFNEHCAFGTMVIKSQDVPTKRTHCGAMEAFVPATLMNIQVRILYTNAAEITNPRPF